ncbi:MAG: two-component system, chemotaxis family, protein-glutamate methylesterase/glutaminase [Frankiaceae bacterium]|jgi:two-component system chemotaxis response regulator CheB|nr:two-component system, chemotaxis family, protein-glutamate methylesterase/glutaminase [Frankiaceae bacterium]
MPHISVLVVDDSVVVRRLVTQALSLDPDIEVIGTASSGRLALERIQQQLPDVVTLDVEMPDMDGLETLREIRRRHPRLPVVMFSSVTERGASATLDALTLGANDYVTKPTNAANQDAAMESVRSQLIPKIKALCGRAIPRERAPEVQRPAAPAAVPVVPRRPSGIDPTGPIDAVAIGASTGGPDALSKVLNALPADFPVPIFIVQHMPPLFTRLFAGRLDSSSQLSVKEARDGDVPAAGNVYIAPGDFHLSLRRDAAGRPRMVVSQEGPENWVRPAVDVLFRSMAEVYGERTLAVVLTGMGQDGMKGSEPIIACGGQIVVQDEATSIVWGMPGSVAQAGLAQHILPLDEIAEHVLRVAHRAGSTTRTDVALGARS